MTHQFRTACQRIESRLIDEADEADTLASIVRGFVESKRHFRRNRLCADLLNALTDAASDAEAAANKSRAEAGQTALDTVREAKHA